MLHQNTSKNKKDKLTKKSYQWARRGIRTHEQS